MRKVTPDRPWPLHDVAATRRIENDAAASLPPHALMERAGLATARLALAIAPHARTLWIACGPGNNGGDGLEAATHLHRWGKQVAVTLSGPPDRLPPDAAASWRKCRAAGVPMADAPPAECDLCIDALLGIGHARPLDGLLAELVRRINGATTPVLSIDVPSGLSADTGASAGVRATHTLSLLTLKPGLFTGGGRDASGTVWFEDLEVPAPAGPPSACLTGPPPARARLHASHKGSYGDVAVIGGAAGMAGAAVLAASAALHAGAGRVYLGPLEAGAGVVAALPEIMVRDWASLPLQDLAVACGCGGGTAVAAVLPRVLRDARSLVLDADALNAIAADPVLAEALRQRAPSPTVVTPHPLEAARLLACSTAEVQADRLRAARVLAERFQCTVVLKGSGTVVAAPGQLPHVNPTGNARLATGGTGDVLAGLVAALMASGLAPLEAATAAVYRHGLLADQWPANQALTAGTLAAAL